MFIRELIRIKAGQFNISDSDSVRVNYYFRNFTFHASTIPNLASHDGALHPLGVFHFDTSGLWLHSRQSSGPSENLFYKCINY